MPSNPLETSTTTYSGPRSRCSGAPRRSSTRAPPSITTCNGQRSPMRDRYRRSSRMLRAPAGCTVRLSRSATAPSISCDRGDHLALEPEPGAVLGPVDEDRERDLLPAAGRAVAREVGDVVQRPGLGDAVVRRRGLAADGLHGAVDADGRQRRLQLVADARV